MLVDTKSVCNVISSDECKRIGAKLKLGGEQLVWFNGLTARSLGTLVLGAEIGEWERKVTYQIMKHKSQIILGYLGLKEFRFTIDCSIGSLVRGRNKDNVPLT